MARTRGNGLSAAEATRILDGYERSSLTRRDYCKQVGIPVTTLDYYRRRHAKKQLSPLVAVKVIEPAGSHGFALVLSNGRRIESGWGFGGITTSSAIVVAITCPHQICR